MVSEERDMRLWPLKRKQAAESITPGSVLLQDVIAVDAAWGMRQPPKEAPSPALGRGERRRMEKEANRGPSRMCFRCGFGAVKGVPNSNLIRAKDLAGNDGWSHASPVVCAGYVRAITSQARESIKESGTDLLRIIRLRIGQLAQYHFHKPKLTSFFVSDGGAGMNTVGGTPQRIRGNTQRLS